MQAAQHTSNNIKAKKRKAKTQFKFNTNAYNDTVCSALYDDCALQVRTLICGWLARLLHMSRPGKSYKAAATRHLILGTVRSQQSPSLLANVLDQSSDLHLRYRLARTQTQQRLYSHSMNASRHLPAASAACRQSLLSLTIKFVII